MAAGTHVNGDTLSVAKVGLAGLRCGVNALLLESYERVIAEIDRELNARS